MYLYGNKRSLRCEIQRECDSLCLIKNLRTWKHVFLNPDIYIWLKTADVCCEKQRTVLYNLMTVQ